MKIYQERSSCGFESHYSYKIVYVIEHEEIIPYVNDFTSPKFSSVVGSIISKVFSTYHNEVTYYHIFGAQQ